MYFHIDVEHLTSIHMVDRLNVVTAFFFPVIATACMIRLLASMPKTATRQAAATCNYNAIPSITQNHNLSPLSVAFL